MSWTFASVLSRKSASFRGEGFGVPGGASEVSGAESGCIPFERASTLSAVASNVSSITYFRCGQRAI
jgi:hypothetical protein